MKNALRQSLVGLKVMVVMTIVLGVGYPAAVWAVGQSMHGRATGQIVSASDGGGSKILGQEFSVKDDGWFHSRPSATRDDGLASAASNLGPSNPALLKLIAQRRAAIVKVEGVAPSAVPPDAVTASASGLDASISPAYAALQIPRVARERGLSPAVVGRLVDRATTGRQLGFLGEPTVNVLLLNRELAQGAH